MMRKKEISASGAVVLWSLSSDFERGRLAEEFDALGLLKYVPNRRTDTSALELSLGAYCEDAKIDYLIEPLQKRSQGYEVRRVLRGDSENDYRPFLKASVTEACDLVIELRGPCEDTAEVLGETLQVRFDAFKRQTTGMAVSKSLIAILESYGGLRLRDAGGAYWLPLDDLDRWESLEQAVTNSALRPELVKLEMLVTGADERGLRTIKNSLSSEISDQAKRILDEVSNGDLGEQALANRKHQALALRDKVARYEAILNEALPVLRGACEEVETAATLAGLAVLQA